MSALKETFVTADNTEGTAQPVTRRGALRWLGGIAAGGAAAFSLASLPGANDAHAGEAQAATITDEEARAITAMAHEMQDYSLDPKQRGVGIFINLQRDAPMTGDQIGQWLKTYFGTQTPPVQADYRVNQSQGTATDLTFYVGGYDFTVNVGDLQGQLGNLLAHHRDVWTPGAATLSSLEQ